MRNSVVSKLSTVECVLLAKHSSFSTWPGPPATQSAAHQFLGDTMNEQLSRVTLMSGKRIRKRVIPTLVWNSGVVLLWAIVIGGFVMLLFHLE